MIIADFTELKYEEAKITVAKNKKTIASLQDSFNPKYRKYSKLSQDCIELENEYRKLEQEYSNTEHNATSTDDMDRKLKEKMSELKEESKELD